MPMDRFKSNSLNSSNFVSLFYTVALQKKKIEDYFSISVCQGRQKIANEAVKMKCYHDCKMICVFLAHILYDCWI